MSQTTIQGRSIRLENKPVIATWAAIAGKKEASGPLAAHYDYTDTDTKFGQSSWEKAESKMQEMALDTALDKAKLKNEDVDLLFAGDLLNQCISSTFSLRNTGIPFLGLYGACSTMGESLALAAMAVNAGYARTAAAMTSSHFAGAERQYRFPLVYGGQRTPTAQWTVTGAGCAILQGHGRGPCVDSVTIGHIVDYGIKDANNMGAAMAPAAYHTIKDHLHNLGLKHTDYDLIVTGDLGKLGKQIVADFFAKDGIVLGDLYNDCGCMVYDLQKQDVHCGGSGCGCSAITLCGYLLNEIKKGKLGRVLFCATGALLSPTSSQQGESIPGICHAVSISAERR